MEPASYKLQSFIGHLSWCCINSEEEGCSLSLKPLHSCHIFSAILLEKVSNSPGTNLGIIWDDSLQVSLQSGEMSCEERGY